MTIDEELTLSYYKEISELNKDHGVFLVKNIQTGRLGVKKVLSVFNVDVYRSLIRHPVRNTPRIYEAIEDGGKLIVIEEYINGTSLKEILDGGVLSEEDAVAIAIKLCRIVRDLHRQTPPIVHRDIKPSNIILTDEGRVKLLDMNAAKQYQGDTGQDTQLIGTVGFAAPEQYGFGSSTPQTDIYAIGVLMAFLVHGTFARQSLSASAYDRIVEKCTRMDPEDRYVSVDEVIEELTRIWNGTADDGASKKAEKKTGRFIPWLLPGFRALKPIRMAVSLLLYGMLAAGVTGATIEGVTSPALLWFNRVMLFLAVIAAILVIGNYMDIWDALGITRIRNRWLRWIVAVLAGAAAFMLVMIMLVLIEMIIGA